MTAQRSQNIPFLIIGGGLAGAKAAEAIRQEGAKGRIILLSREQERPYHRPPLSKDFLRAETKRDDVFVHPADWAQPPRAQRFERHVDVFLLCKSERELAPARPAALEHALGGDADLAAVDDERDLAVVGVAGHDPDAEGNIGSLTSAASIKEPCFAIELISLVVKQQRVVRVGNERPIEEGARVPKPLEIARNGCSVDLPSRRICPLGSSGERRRLD